jgi:hypothetical protein
MMYPWRLSRPDSEPLQPSLWQAHLLAEAGVARVPSRGWSGGEKASIFGTLFWPWAGARR